MTTMISATFDKLSHANHQVKEIAYAATPASALFDGSVQGSNVFVVGALTGNITIPAVTSPVTGQVYLFMLTQDGTGGRTVTWDAQYVFQTAWSDTGNDASKKSLAAFVYDGAKMVALANAANSWY